jgi:transcriptional regulator with XRE-family HTH domain
MEQQLASVEYRECGLENVLLEQVPVWRCANGHEDLQVPSVDNLHLVLAKMLLVQPWPLSGPDVRFLRKFLGYSARAFSSRLGLNHVTLSKFENGRMRTPRRLEALVRLYCAQSICERFGHAFPRPLIPVLELLEEGDSTFRDQLRVEHMRPSDGGIAEPTHVWRQSVSA